MAPSTRSDSRIRFGQFDVDLAQQRLLHRGITVRLESHPFQVLSALLEHPGEIVTREHLRHRLWPNGTYVDFEEGLNTAVKKLRYALQDSADNPRFVETVPRRGYRFIAPTEASAPPADAVPPPLVPQSPAATPATAPLKLRFVPWLVAAATLTILAAAAVRYRSPHPVAHEPALQNLRFTKLTDSGKVEDAVISPDGRYLAYLHGDGRGWDQLDGWEGGKSSLRLRQVATRSEVQILVKDADLYPGLSFSPDGNYIYFLRNADQDQMLRDLYQIATLGGSERRLIHDIDTAVAFSPDGRQFVYQRSLQRQMLIEVRIANADGTSDHLLTTLPDGGTPLGCAWSPDGKSIAASHFHFGRSPDFHIDVISLNHPQPALLFSSTSAIGRPRWLPDGSALLFVLQDANRRGQIWEVSYPGGKAHQITNDASNYDLTFDTTPDTRSLMAMEISLVSSLEVASSSDPSRSREFSAGDLPILNVLPLPNDRIVMLRGGDRELWSMKSDGSSLRFLGLHELVWPARCGPYLVFAARASVTRANLDGSAAKILATGWSPVCSPDARFIYYAELTNPRWKIRRIPIDGGPAIDIADNPGESIPGLLSISPDGKWLAFPFDQYGPTPVMQIAIVPAAGSAAPRFLHPPGSLDAGPRWSFDGKSLQYLIDRDGASNLWEQSVNSGAARQITRFSSGKIFDFQWSLDGKQLYLCRGAISADAILIQNP